jgi:hypothetical protein
VLAGPSDSRGGWFGVLECVAVWLINSQLPSVQRDEADTGGESESTGGVRMGGASTMLVIREFAGRLLIYFL